MLSVAGQEFRHAIDGIDEHRRSGVDVARARRSAQCVDTGLATLLDRGEERLPIGPAEDSLCLRHVAYPATPTGFWEGP